MKKDNLKDKSDKKKEHDLDSELKECRTALKQTKSELKQITELARIGSWEWNVKNNKVYWSDALFTIFGVKKQTPTFELAYQLVHSDDRAFWKHSVESAVKKGDPIVIDYRAERPDGKIIWIHNESYCRKDKRGEVIAYEGTAQDITERKASLLELQESKRALTTLMGNLQGMVYRCKNNRDYDMTFVSDGCRELTGYEKEALEQSREIVYGKLIHTEDRDYVWNAVQNAIKKKERFEIEYRIIKKSGKLKWVWERGLGIFDDKGKVTHLEGFISDISDRKNVENKLQKHHSRLEQIVKKRTAELEKINRELREQNAQLEKYHELFISREFRIKELREQVQKLEDKINK